MTLANLDKVWVFVRINSNYIEMKNIPDYICFKARNNTQVKITQTKKQQQNMHAFISLK